VNNTILRLEYLRLRTLVKKLLSLDNPGTLEVDDPAYLVLIGRNKGWVVEFELWLDDEMLVGYISTGVTGVPGDKKQQFEFERRVSIEETADIIAVRLLGWIENQEGG